MEVLLYAFLSYLLEDFLTGNIPLGNHFIQEVSLSLPKKELPGFLL